MDMMKNLYKRQKLLANFSLMERKIHKKLNEKRNNIIPNKRFN